MTKPKTPKRTHMNQPPPQFDLTNCTPQELAEQIRAGALGDLATLIHLALELRLHADQSETRYMKLLYAIQLSDIWRQIDIGTFENFLTRHCHCDPVRYHTGVVVFQTIPAARVEAISFGAAREVAKVADPQRREQALRLCEQWAQDNQRPPSPQTARKLAGIGPVGPSPQTQRRLSMEEENVRLRTEIDRLRTLVVNLGGDPDARPEAAE
jgi:hypothetical protein